MTGFLDEPDLRHIRECGPPSLPRPLYDFAAVLSVALRIEPELIRTVRRELFPRLDVDAEGDFWFSDLVLSRGPKGVVLDPEARRNLHGHLAQMVATQPSADRVHGVWDCIADVHRRLSPALRLEEYITWLALSGRAQDIDAALAPALKAVIVEDREGVAKWFASAWYRLPAPAQQTAAAWKLAHVSLRHQSRRRPHFASTPPLTATDLNDVVHLLDDAHINVRRTGDLIELGNLGPGRGARSLSIPDTYPRLLTLVDPAAVEEEHISVAPGEVVSRRVGPQPVRLRTARGLEYELPAPDSGAPERRGLFMAVVPDDHERDHPAGSAAVRRLTGVLRKAGYDTRTTMDLSEAAALAGDFSTVLVLVSGHAVRRAEDGSLFLTSDGVTDGIDTGAAVENVEAVLASVRAEQFLLVLDLCEVRGPDGRTTLAPSPSEERHWRGRFVSHAPHRSGSDPSRLVETLCDLLTRGPAPEARDAWHADREFITGEDLCTTALAHVPHHASFASRGQARPMFPNPGYGTEAAAETHTPSPTRTDPPRSERPAVTDLVVVLPTFMGSTLRQGNKTVWGTAPTEMMRMALRAPALFRTLMLPDDIGDGPAPDGVIPAALIRDVVTLPGVSITSGYDRLLSFLRRLGCRDVTVGTGSAPGNLLPLPYDWRLSNRQVGAWLGTVIEPVLERWRAQGGPYHDAKVIFVCHGTGGLAARWYTAHADGAAITKCLITIGTPLRGLPRMAHQMVHGSGMVRAMREASSAFLRTLPAAYQLLPQYACVERGVELVPLTEEPLPPLHPAKVRDGVRFTTELLETELAQPDGLFERYSIIGTGQPTPTTLRIADGVVTMLDTYRGEDFSGDATVPRVSAFRPGEGLRSVQTVQSRHGDLHTNSQVLSGLEMAIVRSPLNNVR
ncbi:esterase/lipase family protein [Streptomyces sp. NPDC096132]|uniref:esterase/lipase family protein n=1 Tax=Streptomyces sp. NPDC096132 TaxID=3366075 RepID=UPI0037F48AAA